MAVQMDPSVYKIVSVYDGRCLDVRGQRHAKNGTQIITWNFHGGPNQLWKASLQDEGVILASVDQLPYFNCCRVIEQRMEDGKVQIYDDQKSLNQKWYLEEVQVGESKTYIIWNLANNKCLQNNGNGKQVTAVEPKMIIPHHQWRIERT